MDGTFLKKRIRYIIYHIYRTLRMPRESRRHRRGRERSRSRGQERRARNYREDAGYRNEDLVCGQWERKGFFVTVFTFVTIVSAGVAVYALGLVKPSGTGTTSSLQNSRESRQIKHCSATNNTCHFNAVCSLNADAFICECKSG